ncbi:MAG: hypothetical protein R2867_11140 [Caldilineaceae bacterium]
MTRLIRSRSLSLSVVTADDGQCLFLMNRLVDDEWRHQAATTYTEAEITSGTTNVRLDYYEKPRPSNHTLFLCRSAQ